MSLQRIFPWLLTALAASVAVMVTGARHGLPLLAGAAAAVFAGAVLAVGVSINQPLWTLEAARITEHAAPVAARRNARLMAVTFAWGSAAIFAVYAMSGLRWYHFWQYGSAMALLAASTFAYGAVVGRARDPVRARKLLLRGLQLTILQGAAALGGVLFIVLSGKLASQKPDWVANQIFLFGGLAITALCVIAAMTQRRLAR